MESDLPYETRECDKFGRYLIASRDLKARELIISEEPLIEGPTDDQDEQVPLCLSCCYKMTENQYSRCSLCHFPLCGSSCEKATVHAENECKIFRANKVSYPPPFTSHVLNKSIIILRCLLLREKNPLKWNQLMTMSPNSEFRRNRPNCIRLDERIVENFKKYLGENLNVEDLLKISGIVDVNAHSYPVKVNGKVVASKCHVYYRTSLIAHSCSPNSSWAPGQDKNSLKSTSTLVIRTNRPVCKGEIISCAYDDSDLLFGTIRRLIKMERGMFICQCVRCLDPTELGTFLSALKCQSCLEGFLLSINPTNSFSDWKCNNYSCGKILDEIEVADIIDEAESAVGFPKEDVLSEEPDEHVELLKEYVDEFSGTILHPNHYILQEVKLRIIRSQCFNLGNLSNTDLEQFLNRCKHLLDISDILIPGFGEYRAFLEYHYFRALLESQDRKSLNFNSTTITSSTEFKDFLNTHKKILILQEQVLVFLEDKFTFNKRIEYIRETMTFIKDQIMRMESEMSLHERK